MVVSKLFWFVSVVLVVFLGLQIAGHSAVEIIISLVIIDLIALKLGQESSSEREISKERVISGIGKIEELLIDLTKFMRSNISAPASNPSGSSNPGSKPAQTSSLQDITLGGIERGIKQNADKLREEFKEGLDRIAKKAIEIENSITHQKKIFSTAVASLDDRIRSVELDIRESVDEAVPDMI
ncbi:MAG: hypothetical protein ISS95_00730 [Candidatus Aenigmarchaeota archaeon]|nr:hypothetical protein [Candidatus Aenigmarchaeota archaeon]